MATITTERRTTEEQQPTKRRRGRLVLLLVGGLAALAAAYWFLLAGGDEQPAEPVKGEVVSLEPITMNLADGRLLKVGLALQLTEAAAEHGEVSGAPALDEAIAFLGEHSFAELSAKGAREKAKAELSRRVGERYHGDVMEVLFTEFVMQ